MLRKDQIKYSHKVVSSYSHLMKIHEEDIVPNDEVKRRSWREREHERERGARERERERAAPSSASSEKSDATLRPLCAACVAMRRQCLCLPAALPPCAPPISLDRHTHLTPFPLSPPPSSPTLVPRASRIPHPASRIPPPASVSVLRQIRSVFLLNCGGSIDLQQNFPMEDHCTCYVIDSHLPFAHPNIHGDCSVRSERCGGVSVSDVCLRV